VTWYAQALGVAAAIACGLLIGIERGFDLRGLRAGTRVAGVRTFTLVGLVSKNGILIVEFANKLQEQGKDKLHAVIEAAGTRLRPILMTSVAFVAGVAPLAFGSGAGAEMRQALGIAVFFGMIGVTLFGLLFTPVFYVVCRWIGARLPKPPPLMPWRKRPLDASPVVAAHTPREADT